MAVREVVIWPDPGLKAQADPVKVFDGHLQALLDDMVETMYAEEGVGLAGPQVGVCMRVFVVDPEPNEPDSRPRFFINPEIIEAEGETLFEEGCLSVPGEVIEIPRHTSVKVRAQDRDGHSFELEAEGLLAIAIQHELDHLDGALIVDRLSALKRDMVKKKMIALKAERAEIGPRPE